MRRGILATATFVLFLGWLWSGWLYLKNQFPVKIWDEGRIPALAEG